MVDAESFLPGILPYFQPKDGSMSPKFLLLPAGASSIFSSISQSLVSKLPNKNWLPFEIILRYPVHEPLGLLLDVCRDLLALDDDLLRENANNPPESRLPQFGSYLIFPFFADLPHITTFFKIIAGEATAEETNFFFDVFSDEMTDKKIEIFTVILEIFARAQKNMYQTDGILISINNLNMLDQDTLLWLGYFLITEISVPLVILSVEPPSLNECSHLLQQLLQSQENRMIRISATSAPTSPGIEIKKKIVPRLINAPDEITPISNTVKPITPKVQENSDQNQEILPIPLTQQDFKPKFIPKPIEPTLSPENSPNPDGPTATKPKFIPRLIEPIEPPVPKPSIPQPENIEKKQEVQVDKPHQNPPTEACTPSGPQFLPSRDQVQRRMALRAKQKAEQTKHPLISSIELQNTPTTVAFRPREGFLARADKSPKVLEKAPGPDAVALATESQVLYDFIFRPKEAEQDS
jgi:hypothetical protein